MFKDRKAAGEMLAQKLSPYKGKDTVVLALPRGGVVLGFQITKALSAPLDIVAIRKIGHPRNPEYAIGAVDETGTLILNEMETVDVDPQWLKSEVEVQKAEAQRRAVLYRGRARQNLKGKTVIIVDDGIATGYTMRLAVRAVRKENAKEIVVAVPVCPAESIVTLKSEDADEVIVLAPPEEFLGAVGAHYEQFEQVDDTEVVRLLAGR